jgi:hypothetical protein
MTKLRIVQGLRQFCFAMPADFPRHDCTPYRGLHARRGSLGFVRRSRAIFCRPAPNPNSPIRTFLIVVGRARTSSITHAVTKPETGLILAMQSVCQMLAHTSPSIHSSSFSHFTGTPLSVTCERASADLNHTRENHRSSVQVLELLGRELIASTHLHGAHELEARGVEEVQHGAGVRGDEWVVI